MLPRVLSVLMVLASFASFAHAQQIPPPSKQEVDISEVYRRGDSVTVAGEGPRSPAAEAGNQATAPPEDDSHKWFVTVWSIEKCGHCAKLIRDFQTAPELLAFVSAPEPSKAWAHFNVYNGNDETQKFRRIPFMVQVYPTIVIQPPLDYSWGPPTNAVSFIEGYNGDAKKLAARITSDVRRYAAAMAKQGYPRAPRQIPIQAKENAESTSSSAGDATDDEPNAQPAVQKPAAADSAPAKKAPAPRSSSFDKTALHVTPAMHLTMVPLIGQTAPFSTPAQPPAFNPQPPLQRFPNQQPQTEWPPQDQPQVERQPKDQPSLLNRDYTAMDLIGFAWMLMKFLWSVALTILLIVLLVRVTKLERTVAELPVPVATAATTSKTR